MKFFLLTLIAMILVAPPGFAQSQNPPNSEAEENTLAREVDDPTANLAQLKFQDIYTPGNFQSSAQTNAVQVQAPIPVAPFSLIPFQELVRPTFKVTTSAISGGSSTVTGFADIELFDLFISNWPDPKKTGFAWAVGPTFVFPTGRVAGAGKNAWQVGPAVGAAYRGIPRLMVGFLFQNPISFAYATPSASPQSQVKFQPTVSYTLGRGWYVKSSDSTWTMNWRHGTSTVIPVSLGFGKVWKFARVNPNVWVSGEWTAYQQNAGITPMYTVRFGLNLLVPQFELGEW
jgi:hypothetical protein